MLRITLFSNTRGLIFAASQDGTKWDWENADSNQLQPTNNAASRVAMSQPYQGVYGEYGRPWPRDGSVGNRLQPEWAAVSFRCVLSWQQYPPPPLPIPCNSCPRGSPCPSAWRSRASREMQCKRCGASAAKVVLTEKSYYCRHCPQADRGWRDRHDRTMGRLCSAESGAAWRRVQLGWQNTDRGGINNTAGGSIARAESIP